MVTVVVFLVVPGSRLPASGACWGLHAAACEALVLALFPHSLPSHSCGEEEKEEAEQTEPTSLKVPRVPGPQDFSPPPDQAP